MLQLPGGDGETDAVKVLVPDRVGLTGIYPAGSINGNVACIEEPELWPNQLCLGSVGRHEDHVNVISSYRFEFQWHLQRILQAFFAGFALIDFQYPLDDRAVVIIRFEVTGCSYQFPVFL